MLNNVKYKVRLFCAVLAILLPHDQAHAHSVAGCPQNQNLTLQDYIKIAKHSQTLYEKVFKYIPKDIKIIDKKGIYTVVMPMVYTYRLPISKNGYEYNKYLLNGIGFWGKFDAECQIEDSQGRIWLAGEVGGRMEYVLKNESKIKIIDTK